MSKTSQTHKYLGNYLEYNYKYYLWRYVFVGIFLNIFLKTGDAMVMMERTVKF